MKNIYGYDTNIYETSIGNLKNIDKENHSVIATKFYVMQQELDQYKNIIDELEKWLKEYSEKDTASSIIFLRCLNYLKELKEDK